VTFINYMMLFGLIALAVPVLIHLLNRSRAKVLDWGAMRFLLASLTSQNRRILIEEVILLALRCLLVALVVLAMARPFLPSRSSVPWAIALPALLGAVISLGVAAAMWHYRKARWGMLVLSLALACVAGGASAVERYWQEIKWATGRGERDVAILIDASMSMTVNVEGRTNFERAVEEARTVAGTCRPGDAVSLILAGPVPRAVIATPTADRAELAAALQGLKPIGGTMSVLEALNVAAASLAEGHNAVKKIVLITDGQNVGWDVRSEARWRFLADGLKGLPSKPRIICRWLPLPRIFRNVAVAEVGFSRKVVGTDRPVKIDVKVMNTGTVTIKPLAVELTVDGAKVATERAVTEILPRAAETVRFEHRFEHPGPRLVSAHVVMADDLAADNTAARVLNVIDKLSVLIVDGAPSTRPLGGAAAFIDVALTPRPDAEEPPHTVDKPVPVSKKDAAAIKDIDEIRFLVEPKVVAAPEIATVKSFRDYAVVVLANVPRLPEASAKDLVGFVEAGGGLLVAPGVRAKPTFYNSWSTASAEPIMPADLLERRDVADTPTRLEPKTFSHPALRLLSDPKQSDAAMAMVKCYWKLAANDKDPDVRIGGRLSTGEPFLVERRVGKGYVLLTATSLDPSGSNLPALKSFVPIMHELVYYLAAPMMLDPNVTPGSEVTLELRNRLAGAARSAGIGLRAEYYSDRDLRTLRASRIDAAVNFDWGKTRPVPSVGEDNFSVRWTGWVQPRYSERYKFYTLADDGVRLWVDDRQLVDAWRGQNPTEYSGSVALTAGRRYKLRMEFFEGDGDAVAKLFWSSPSQRKEIVPQSQLFPAWTPSAPATASASEQVEAAEVITPSQRRCPARITADDGSLRVSFSETQEPGLYTLILPPDLAAIYAPEGTDGKGLPFVALSRVEESCLDGLTKADMDLAGQHIDLFETERTDELTSAVSGGIPGEELWKYLAIGALFALVAEIAITRWIAIQRRLGATETVVFGSDAVDVQTFRDRAMELLKVPAEGVESQI